MNNGLDRCGSRSEWLALLQRAIRTLGAKGVLSSILISTALTGCGTSEDQALVRELEKRERRLEVQQPVENAVEYPTTWRGSRTETLAPGVHALGELYPSAAYIVETSEGPILIDAGVDESAWQVRASMVELGLVIDQTKAVFLTHAHYDHVLGANKIREVSGAMVCAGRNDCETLRTADQDELFSLFPKVEFSGTPIQIDRELDDGDVIEIGDVTVTVIGAPGHTPGSVCYLVEKEKQRILFSGDVIASLNMGPATYPAKISPRYRGDAQDYLNTVNRLLEFDPPDLLLTGHPQQYRRIQPLSLNQAEWNQLLQPAKDELKELVARHQRDGADFLDDVPKRIEPGLFHLGTLDSTAVYALFHGSDLIVINSPGGEEFDDFVESRLDALGLESMAPTLVLLTSAKRSNYSGVASFQPPPHVLAPDSAVETLRLEGVENVLSTHQIKEFGPLPIRVIPLAGHSDSLLAYTCSVGEKQVLITPDIPRNIILVWTDRRTGVQTRSNLAPQHNELEKALKASRESAASYRESLEKLSEFAPDVWLPSWPRTGQNANLYDDDWQMLIEDNMDAVEAFAPR